MGADCGSCRDLPAFWPVRAEVGVGVGVVVAGRLVDAGRVVGDVLGDEDSGLCHGSVEHQRVGLTGGVGCPKHAS